MFEGFGSNKRRKVNLEDESEHVKPWVEKYRPRKLDEITAQDHTISVLKKALTSANLPHMLFYGPPGTGKTSTILALTKELYGPELSKSRVLELNASDERGISIVREKIKNFARLTVSKPSKEDLAKYPCPPYKIIVLDEADSMTSDAQSALRRTMENYSNVTRFCLICNYVTRIIDPLGSRCSKFRFKSLDESNAMDRLRQISKLEKVPYEEGSLEKILEISNGDLRKAITLLQSSTKRLISETADKITPEDIEELAGLVPTPILHELIDKVSQRNIAEIIKYVNEFVKNGWSAVSVINQLHDHYITSSEHGTYFKNKTSLLLFEADAKIANGTNEHLQILNLLVQISQVPT